jgi:hypothetical protein
MMLLYVLSLLAVVLVYVPSLWQQRTKRKGEPPTIENTVPFLSTIYQILKHRADFYLRMRLVRDLFNQPVVFRKG